MSQPSRGRGGRWGRVRGYTLVEVLVVLVVMVIAAGVVAPVFLPPRRDEASADLAQLVRAARSTAARRGEVLFVRLSASGAWRMEGATSATAGGVATGVISGYTGPAASIIVSPLGSCAFDVRSTAGALAVPLDPMSCEVTER